MKNDIASSTRRRFLRDLGLSTAVLPFLGGLPSLQAAPRKRSAQRIVFVFTPNGTVPGEFWPETAGSDFQLKPILEPLAAYRDRMLIVKGLCNRVRGDGDGHMRGMSCLLTGIELLPGNIQGGSDTPAGWASGPSIDQELKGFLQSRPETRTRFGSLELGVGVPHRADPWTRWTYAGSNQPVAPLSDPYEVFEKLFGQVKDRENLGSVLDQVRSDLQRVSQKLGREERALLERNATLVREMEREISEAGRQKLRVAAPVLEPGIGNENDTIPQVSRREADVLVNAFANVMARVASLQ